RAFDEWKKQEAEKQKTLKREAVKLIVATRLVTVDGFEAIACPTDREAYARLCRLLTEGKHKAKPPEHTECHLAFEEILGAADGQILIALPPEDLTLAFTERLERLARAAPGRSYLAGIHRYRGDEPRRLGELDDLARRSGTP